MTRGFHAYGYTPSDFIGWTNATGDADMASVNGHSSALSAQAVGAGHEVYIGWNVYGPLATTDDLRVFQRSIEWAYDGTASSPDDVPEPAMLGLFGMGAIGLGVTRRRRRA